MTAADTLPALVDADIEGFIAAQRRRMDALGPEITPFLDVAAEAVAGGKRLRAAYCHAGWCAVGGDPDDRGILWAASALEWLQASALVHDDVMDGSDVRRGRPAAHRRFEQLHRESQWRGDAERFGVGGAILLGDLLLSWCDEMFGSSGLPQGSIERAKPYLDACKTEVVGGQFLDLVGQAAGVDSVENAMRIVRFKAAKYTVERPLHLGAALAGGTSEDIATLSAVGLPLGEAFQLRDDVLGVFGDPSVTGKPAGDDLREGKRTVLVAHASRLAPPEHRAALAQHLGDPELDGETVEQLREIIVGSGALAQVEADIAALEAQADTALLSGPLPEDARERLASLATRSTKRSA